jgi:hypothetical protein
MIVDVIHLLIKESISDLDSFNENFNSLENTESMPTYLVSVPHTHNEYYLLSRGLEH